MKKILLFLIVLSLLWKFSPLSFNFSDFFYSNDTKRPAKVQKRHPYAYKPTHYFLKTLNRRYWGGSRVFFKRLKPILDRYKARVANNPEVLNTIIKVNFEVDCNSEVRLLNVQSAPHPEFLEDMNDFLNSAKFRWLECTTIYPDRFELYLYLGE